MTYCFLARPGLNSFSPKVFKEIQLRYDKNATGIFITMNEDESKVVRDIYVDAIVYNFSEYMKKHWHNFSIESLCRYEKKYDCAPVWKYIYTDRFLINKDYDYTVKTASGLFSFFEDIFTKHEVDYYYSETIATLMCYVAYLVGKKTNTKYVGQTCARGLDSTYHWIINDPYGYISNLEVKTNTCFGRDEIERAETFLRGFEEKEIIPQYMIIYGGRPKIRFIDLLSIGARFLGRFKKNLSDPYCYIYFQSYKNSTNALKYYLRYHYSRLKYYREADYSRKYIYFPLHYQPEASTIVSAQKYEKQLFFIDSWAKSLPADTVMYVKEHYTLLGNRPISFYKELKKYPNVILISPWESSRKLMLNSVAVTTLTGTAGWEAMLLRKPVIIGGNAFFEKAPGVIKTDDIFGNYLNYLAQWKKPSRDDIIYYLCNYFRAIRPGCIWGYGEELSESDKNISLITDSLMSSIHHEVRKANY